MSFPALDKIKRDREPIGILFTIERCIRLVSISKFDETIAKED